MLLGKFVLFTLTSSVSYVSMMLMIFSLFRINYRWYIPHTMFVCVSLSYISFTTRVASLAIYSPFVQLAFLIVLLWLLFRFHPFHALIMGVTGYTCILALDAAVAAIVILAGHTIPQMSVQMHPLGVIVGLLGIGVAVLISRQNWGFSFVREDERVKINLREKNNVLFLVASIVVVIGFFVGYFCALYISTPASFLFTAIFLLLSAILLIYLSGRREHQQYEQNRGRMWMRK